MGFMDKAKKVAEQAQQKLEEAQKEFNARQGSTPSQAPGAATRYDEHGRPIPGEPAPPQAGEAAPPQAAEPSEEPPAAPPAADPGAGDRNTNPDPFKPLGG